MKYLIKWKTFKNKNVRSLRIVLLSLFSISFVLTTVSGTTIQVWLGLYTFEISFGFGIAEWE